MTSRKAGFDLPAIALAQARRAGMSFIPYFKKKKALQERVLRE